eukprot:TRINITY_DN49781_c0_g1_i1.p1 TRINITY_DN49781_c0_g1~~TRINITY_DN49781_c0_g1_i1.p1  ORF type:complete len:407 (+),score=46.13 TRINITY_DN49781_c0_g1_i1:87-1307(+)
MFFRLIIYVLSAPASAVHQIDGGLFSDDTDATKSKLLRSEAQLRIVAPLSIPTESTPIHLSIAAFQDGERCSKTIARALEQAANPRRFSFGVVQARTKKDIDCVAHFSNTHLPALCDTLKSHFTDSESCQDIVLSSVKQRLIHPSEAEGPAHQRSMSIQLIDFERSDKFCMETDSHMDFMRDWDRLLTDDWLATKNEFAVMSAYVMDISRTDDANETFVDCCGYELDGDGIPRGNQCGEFHRREGMKPLLTTLWAAGLSFHRCHAERNVPIDPNLEWLFTGEEVSRAVRLWTNGYDIYLPTRSVVLHNYSHASQKFWNSADPATVAKKQEASQKKLKKLLNLVTIDDNVGPYYGLGKQRTLKEFATWGKPLHRHSCRDPPLERAPVADAKALSDSVTKRTNIVTTP